MGIPGNPKETKELDDFWQCFCVAFVQTSSLSFGSWTDSHRGGAFSRVAKLANIPRRRARVPQRVDSWHWTSMNQLCMCSPPVIILWSKESLLFHQVSFHLKRWKCLSCSFNGSRLKIERTDFRHESKRKFEDVWYDQPFGYPSLQLPEFLIGMIAVKM